MKFGKRRKETDAPGSADAQAPGATSAPPPATQSPTPLGADPAAPAYQPLQPAEAFEPPYLEPVVEGEAVELPAAEPPAPEFHQPVPLTYRGAQPAPDPMPYPIADQPVGAVSSAGPAAAVSSLGDAGEAFASGHGAAPGPSWQEPVMQLADERPELVVAAAFAGGVLAALILRRLGS